LYLFFSGPKWLSYQHILIHDETNLVDRGTSEPRKCQVRFCTELNKIALPIIVKEVKLLSPSVSLHLTTILGRTPTGRARHSKRLIYAGSIPRRPVFHKMFLWWQWLAHWNGLGLTTYVEYVRFSISQEGPDRHAGWWRVRVKLAPQAVYKLKIDD